MFKHEVQFHPTYPNFLVYDVKILSMGALLALALNTSAL